MRKRVLYVMTAIMAVFAFTCCSRVAPNSKQEIRIDVTEYSVPSEGGEIGVKFVPVLAWTATSEADWLTISPASGDASDEEVTMTVSVTPNGTSMRVADILLSTEAGDVSVSVIQEAADLIALFEMTEYEVPIEGGEIKAKFTAPENWKVECEEDWVSFSPESGKASTRNKTLTITVDSNEGGKARKASLYVVFANGEVELKIRQAGENSGSSSDTDDPSDPEDPTDPENPTDPEDPNDPNDPDDPNDPSDPSDPDYPGDADDEGAQAGAEDVNKGEDVGITK